MESSKPRGVKLQKERAQN